MIKFEDHEIAFGLLLEKQINDARVRLEERQLMLEQYIQFLGNKYGLSGDVALNDWMKGFEVTGNE